MNNADLKLASKMLGNDAQYYLKVAELPAAGRAMVAAKMLVDRELTALSAPALPNNTVSSLHAKRLAALKEVVENRGFLSGSQASELLQIAMEAING